VKQPLGNQRRAFGAIAVIASLSVGACTGDISESGGTGSGAGGPSGNLQCTAKVRPRLAPLRRMTRTQYQNTIGELFKGAVSPSAKFPNAEVVDTFSNDLERNTVDQAGAEGIFNAATETAVALVPVLSQWLGCDAATAGEQACLSVLLDEAATRVQRRPLAADERATLQQLFAEVRPNSSGFAEAAVELVRALLASPQFIYLDETGDLASASGAATRLSDYQVASRLSYLFWESMPDSELFGLAASGKLRTPVQLREQAERMLQDPRARKTVSRFYREWLQLPRLNAAVKDAQAFPEFDAALVASMNLELESFTNDVTWKPGGNLAMLFNDSSRVVDPALAALYGVAPGTGTAPITLPASRRAGIFTTAGFLSAHAHPGRTSPVKRGRFIREFVLCQTIKSPPASVDVTLPPIDPNKSVREQLAQHRTDPSCASCHQMMDPIGFAFEHYDALGKWRDTDGNVPVDAAGEITASESADGTFDGAVELSAALAESPQVRQCVATQWLRFSSGRREQESDSCDIEDLTMRFEQNSTNLRSLLLELTQLPGFLYRPSPDLEGT
jgi:hypothetical protein